MFTELKKTRKTRSDKRQCITHVLARRQLAEYFKRNGSTKIIDPAQLIKPESEFYSKVDIICPRAQLVQIYKALAEFNYEPINKEFQFKTIQRFKDGSLASNDWPGWRKNLYCLKGMGYERISEALVEYGKEKDLWNYKQFGYEWDNGMDKRLSDAIKTVIIRPSRYLGMVLATDIIKLACSNGMEDASVKPALKAAMKIYGYEKFDNQDCKDGRWTIDGNSTTLYEKKRECIYG